MKSRGWTKALVSIALCMAACVLSILLGSVSLSLQDMVRIFAHKLFGAALPDTIPPASVAILWTIRLPRVLMALLVGSMLSVSGTVMQSAMRNPLASSYTLGVSSGASLGAAVIILTGFTLPVFGGYTLPLFGLVFGLMVVFAAVLFASRVDVNMRSNTIILAGMVFSMFVNAVLTLLYSFAGENAQRILRWQMGSFALKDFSHVGLLLPVGIVGVVLLSAFSRELDMLSFGEEDAAAMGVDTVRVKWALLSLSAALTGSAVAFVGVVGFIDLIAPHVVRRIFGARHAWVVPMSAVFGGGFMVLCDLAARTLLAPSEIPVGAVTALLGAPFFAYIYFRRREGSRP